MQIYAFKLDILTFKHLINILKLRYAQNIKREEGDFKFL